MVGTGNARLASNALSSFLDKAKTFCIIKIDVISGVEEARKYYLGVAYTFQLTKQIRW